MHIHTLNEWKHSHDYLSDSSHNEKKVRWVIVITALVMAAEIFGGIVFGSMAVLADGWHMGTHVTAFGITIFAYHYARKHAGSLRFAFGPGKVTVLGGFASAVGLAVVALVMAVESFMRVIEPKTIYYNQALLVAVIGLLANAVCAMLLNNAGTHHHHGHSDSHHEDHDDQSHDHHPGQPHKRHNDHNIKAAYFHVLADALTSITAIAGLLAAKYFGWVFMDALMGMAGSLVISWWAYGLIKETGPILLDSADTSIQDRIREAIEKDADNRVADLHLWPLGPHKLASIVSIVTHFPKPVDEYKRLLEEIEDLTHTTIEVNHCTSKPCLIPGNSSHGIQ